MWDGQLTNDVVFALLFLLFFCFAFLFHLHYKLFDKMLYDVVHLKERQNLSPVSSGGEWLFRHFMTGQALLLCGVSLFSIARAEGMTISDKDYKSRVDSYAAASSITCWAQCLPTPTATARGARATTP